jgi:hypothetical protein
MGKNSTMYDNIEIIKESSYVGQIPVRQLVRWNWNRMELYKHHIYSIPQPTRYLTLIVSDTTVFDND